MAEVLRPFPSEMLGTIHLSKRLVRSDEDVARVSATGLRLKEALLVESNGE